MKTWRAASVAWLGAVALTLAGCGGASEDAEPFVAVDRDAPVDPSGYAGAVTFRIAETIPVRERELPIALYLGLTPETGSRLGANAVVDLRDLQLELRDILTDEVEAGCSIGLDVDFRGAQAEGDALRARATVDATIYRCRNRGTEDERRGWRILSQTIDVDALLSGRLQGECIEFHLVDLDIAPKNLLGRLATLLGVTERARVAIVETARTTLAENPVCPDLPDPLAALDPRFAEFGLREIGAGGIGAALSGSVDLSAENLLGLLAATAGRATGPAAKATVDAGPGWVGVRFADTITAEDREIPYAVDARLSAVARNRIGVEMRLDLRELQRRLPTLLAGDDLLDTCGGRVSVQTLEADARGTSVIARGELELERFDCERTGPGSWQRGVLVSTEDVGVRAEISAELVEGCVVFRLLDLRRDPPGAFAQLSVAGGRTEAARALLLEAIELLLEDRPICPELPPELAVLDPVFERGMPQEVGDGGIGVELDGSIDVSPQSLVDLLRLLQERGALPPPP